VRIEVVAGAGHFPHEEFPERFIEVLTDFVRTTAPSVYDQSRWRTLLRKGSAATRDRTDRSAVIPALVASAAAPA
jgi:hypothetical protein